MSNVLVYNGPGVSSSALHHTLKTLRTLLPTYDVQTVDAKTLALDPWQQTTSLLVLPGGRDLPYVEELSRLHRRADAPSSDRATQAFQQVNDYVRNHGGSFLGICAGGYYASDHCAFELGSPIQVDGARPFLRFFPGTCSGTVYPGFVYESDRGARIVDLQLAAPFEERPGPSSMGSSSRWRCHYNGGGAFMDADSFRDQGVEVLARYLAPGEEELEFDINLDDKDSELPTEPGQAAHQRLANKKPIYAGQAASVLCSVGKGRALLFGTHPEFPLLASSTAVQLSASREQVLDPTPGQQTTAARKSPDDLLEHERRRLRWLKNVFAGKLGLRAELPGWAMETDEATAAAANTTATTGEPKLLPVILSSTDGSLAATLNSLRQIAAKNTAVVGQLSVDSIAVDDLKDDLVASFQDSNDPIHLYGASARTTDMLFRLCQDAKYDAFSKPVLLSNNEALADNEAGRKNDDVQANEVEVDLDSVPKYILCYDSDAQLPRQELLPYWHITEYRRNLAKFGNAVREMEAEEGNWAQWQRGGGMAHFFGGGWAGAASTGAGSSGSDASSIKVGHTTLYGQMVTSTQTMLDKNFRFLSALPVGTTFLATQQMSGRGRGGNRWISPKGCLQFSSVFKVPLEMAAKTVFLQYLSAMAIVEGIRLALGPSEAASRVADKVRIKWPNDVYAEVPCSEDEEVEPKSAARTATFEHRGKRYAKMAGILVNSQFSGGKEFTLVAGCGINCLNSRPTTSLLELVQLHNRQCEASGSPGPSQLLEEVSQEKLAAAILSVLESMWKGFLRNGGDFGPFVERYRRMWLHSDQEVVLCADAVGGDGNELQLDVEKDAGGSRVRIVGISSDHGLLRAVRVSSGITTWDERAWGRAEPGRRYGQDEVIELQPDGNSFDMLRNLVRRKA